MCFARSMLGDSPITCLRSLTIGRSRMKFGSSPAVTVWSASTISFRMARKVCLRSQMHHPYGLVDEFASRIYLRASCGKKRRAACTHSSSPSNGCSPESSLPPWKRLLRTRLAASTKAPASELIQVLENEARLAPSSDLLDDLGLGSVACPAQDLAQGRRR